MGRGNPNWPNTLVRQEGDLHVITIHEPTMLAQVIGWLKFTTPDHGEVLFRGQESMYEAMLSSGVRGKKTTGALDNLNVAIQSYIDDLYRGGCQCEPPADLFSRAHFCRETALGGATNGSIASGTYRAVTEPLLQHYGLKTRWIDVVDNVWVALWFACHRQISRGRYAYHLRRSVAQEGTDAFVYIAAMDTGKLEPTGIPGYRLSSTIRLSDLRYSVPSIYLRPHAQHGLLVAPRQVSIDPDSYSLTSAFRYYLEIRLADALEWLGTGVMTSTYELFPSAVHDEGYRRLLEYAPTPPEQLGTFTHFGPGL